VETIVLVGGGVRNGNPKFVEGMKKELRNERAMTSRVSKNCICKRKNSEGRNFGEVSAILEGNVQQSKENVSVVREKMKGSMELITKRVSSRAAKIAS
jgi:hypothetical protein